jgi:hypothetical protein
VRTVSAAFQTAIAAGSVRIAELFDVLLSNGTTYRYTSHSSDLTWNAGGDTYTAIPLSRGPIRFNTNGQFDECEITLGIRGAAFMNQVKNNILEAAEITHKMIRWDATYAADEEITLGVWVPDVGFNRASLSLNLRSKLDSLNCRVPRHMYQEPCNNYLFDPTCGLTRANYAYSGTATGGSATTLVDTTRGEVYKVDFDAGDSGNPIERGDTVTGQVGAGTGVVVQIVYLTAATGTIWYVEQSGVQFVDDEELQDAGADAVDVNGTPAEDTEFYEQGEIEMTGGDNSGQSRPVLASSSDTDTLLWPMPATIDNGDTYKIYPGCDQTPATCLARFNNLTPWRGFPFVPLVEETIM